MPASRDMSISRTDPFTTPLRPLYGLQQTITTQELVDLIEYLTSLKKSSAE